jgi:hypothetical protein
MKTISHIVPGTRAAVLFIGTMAGYGQQGSILFQSEKIRIVIDQDQCTLTGDYTFQNSVSDSVQKILYYPIVVDSVLPYPHSFQVEDSYSGETLSYIESSEGIQFLISIPPYSMRTWRVTYQQDCLDRIFEYILLSTYTWERPLNRSEIQIFIPKEFSLIDISLPVKRMEDSEGFQVYYFKQSDFLPDRNLTIRWEES